LKICCRFSLGCKTGGSQRWSGFSAFLETTLDLVALLAFFLVLAWLFSKPTASSLRDEGWKIATHLFCACSVKVRGWLTLELQRACISAREVLGSQSWGQGGPEATGLCPKLQQMGAVPPRGLSCSQGHPCQGVCTLPALLLTIPLLVLSASSIT